MSLSFKKNAFSRQFSKALAKHGFGALKSCNGWNRCERIIYDSDITQGVSFEWNGKKEGFNLYIDYTLNKVEVFRQNCLILYFKKHENENSFHSNPCTLWAQVNLIFSRAKKVCPGFNGVWFNISRKKISEMKIFCNDLANTLLNYFKDLETQQGIMRVILSEDGVNYCPEDIDFLTILMCARKLNLCSLDIEVILKTRPSLKDERHSSGLVMSVFIHEFDSILENEISRINSI